MVHFLTVSLFLLSALAGFNCALLPQGHRETSLRQVVYLFRHGARGPVAFMDSSDAKYWPYGPGELTNDGKKQHLKLGKHFRSRYGKFLGDHYDYIQLSVYSTDVDRTLMSANCHLAGLFPPKGWQVWNKVLRWQPIPVHITQDSTDMLMQFVTSISSCPAYATLFECSLSILDHHDFSGLRQHFKIQGPFTIRNVLQVFLPLVDYVVLMKRNHFPLPDWVTPKIIEECNHFMKVLFPLTVQTDQMKKLTGGRFVWSVLNKFRNYAFGLDRTQKLNIYSGHDANLVAVMGAMDCLIDPTPPFASAFIMELHEESESYFVKTFYKNSTSVPTPVVIPGCRPNCPLEKLVQLTQSVVVDNMVAFRDDCNSVTAC